MFQQMKSRARPAGPCKCSGVCPCHSPRRGFDWLFWCSIFILLGLFAFAIWKVSQLKEEKRSIIVDGKTCTVEIVEDGCTSTGACFGHDEARCP